MTLSVTILGNRPFDTIISHGVLPRDPVPITSACNIPDPIGIGQIPLNGFANAGFKCLPRFPSKFSLNFARVDGIASIMPRAVFDKGDEIAMGDHWVKGPQLIQDHANGFHDLDIGLFVAPPRSEER